MVSLGGISHGGISGSTGRSVFSTGILVMSDVSGAILGAWTQRNNIRKLIGSGATKKYIEEKGGE